jgi:uncharacterized protein
VLVAVDLSRPPDRQVLTKVALSGIQLYQRTLSPWTAAIGIQCRFQPSCSRYAEAVIRRRGVVRGGWMTLTRLARCGPWTPMGTVDQP